MRPRSSILLASLAPALLALTLGACKRDQDSTPPDDGGSQGGDANDRYGGGPTPNDVCTHLFRMAAADAGQPDAQVDQQIIGECIAELEAEVPIRGPQGWAGVANCVVGAQTEADIDACDSAYPLPAGSGSTSDGEFGSPEDMACVHMLEVIFAETAAEQGAVPEVSDDELETLHSDCVRSLLEGEQPNRSPESYQVLVSCIQEATSSAQMQACE
ncbi:MAG: hypothetical protein KC431_11235 [Myxococcales bacterium]|nr:hypothetical protein [Myxococcales bacterium]